MTLRDREIKNKKENEVALFASIQEIERKKKGYRGGQTVNTVLRGYSSRQPRDSQDASINIRLVTLIQKFIL